MSALAKIVMAQGGKVYGSDRNHDHGRFSKKFEKLENDGVKLVPQDGSGIRNDIDYLVVSSAVEDTIPDVRAAKENNVPIVKRAGLLAEICNARASICVGGTNGKSTVTGMIGWMLHQCGGDPTIINGGGMLNFDRDNAVTGQGDNIVVETDESDGTITNFKAHIAILTNIAEDHKDINELMKIFRQYLSQSKYQVLNLDCPHVAKLAKDFPDAYTYSIADYPGNLKLAVPGAHNKSNAMAAISVARILGFGEEEIFNALQSFKGITSRLEVVGVKDGITVIDDFGHNPDKISAGLKTLKENENRLILMYQPHGFAPTRQHKDELIQVFAENLGENDLFYMPQILYFGGTVEKDISSLDIIDPLKEKGMNATYYKNKVDIMQDILKNVRQGDTICIMGARDDALREMAQNIFASLR